MQQPQAWPHHGAPFVVAQAVLYPNRVARQPFLDHRGIDVVVVAPPFVPRVVGRIDENAVNLARMGRQQRLKRVQIVALDDQVAIQPRRTNALVRMRHQRAVWHGQVMVVDKFLALEMQFRLENHPLKRQSSASQQNTQPHH